MGVLLFCCYKDFISHYIKYVTDPDSNYGFVCVQIADELNKVISVNQKIIQMDVEDIRAICNLLIIPVAKSFSTKMVDQDKKNLIFT